MSTLGAYFRLAKVGWVLVREGVVLALPDEGLPASAKFVKGMLKPLARNKALRSERSDRLSKAVSRLGPSYVKMGQFLATRPDVVGADFAEDLAGLQDRVVNDVQQVFSPEIPGARSMKTPGRFRSFTVASLSVTSAICWRR